VLQLTPRHLAGQLVELRSRCQPWSLSPPLAGLSLVGGDPTEATHHLNLALASRRSVRVTNDLRAFAVTARQVGRPDLARLAERAPQN
jgi:hypothetical protein